MEYTEEIVKSVGGFLDRMAPEAREAILERMPEDERVLLKGFGGAKGTPPADEHIAIEDAGKFSHSSWKPGETQKVGNYNVKRSSTGKRFTVHSAEGPSTDALAHVYHTRTGDGGGETAWHSQISNSGGTGIVPTRAHTEFKYALHHAVNRAHRNATGTKAKQLGKSTEDDGELLKGGKANYTPESMRSETKNWGNGETRKFGNVSVTKKAEVGARDEVFHRFFVHKHAEPNPTKNHYAVASTGSRYVRGGADIEHKVPPAENPEAEPWSQHPTIHHALSEAVNMHQKSTNIVKSVGGFLDRMAPEAREAILERMPDDEQELLKGVGPGAAPHPSGLAIGMHVRHKEFGHWGTMKVVGLKPRPTGGHVAQVKHTSGKTSWHETDVLRPAKDSKTEAATTAQQSSNRDRNLTDSSGHLN